jgi:hypothetical protein
MTELERQLLKALESLEGGYRAQHAAWETPTAICGRCSRPPLPRTGHCERAWELEQAGVALERSSRDIEPKIEALNIELEPRRSSMSLGREYRVW